MKSETVLPLVDPQIERKICFQLARQWLASPAVGDPTQFLANGIFAARQQARQEGLSISSSSRIPALDGHIEHLRSELSTQRRLYEDLAKRIETLQASFDEPSRSCVAWDGESDSFWAAIAAHAKGQSTEADFAVIFEVLWLASRPHHAVDALIDAAYHVSIWADKQDLSPTTTKMFEALKQAVQPLAGMRKRDHAAVIEQARAQVRDEVM